MTVDYLSLPMQKLCNKISSCFCPLFQANSHDHLTPIRQNSTLHIHHVIPLHDLSHLLSDNPLIKRLTISIPLSLSITSLIVGSCKSLIHLTLRNGNYDPGSLRNILKLSCIETLVIAAPAKCKSKKQWCDPRIFGNCAALKHFIVEEGTQQGPIQSVQVHAALQLCLNVLSSCSNLHSLELEFPLNTNGVTNSRTEYLLSALAHSTLTAKRLCKIVLNLYGYHTNVELPTVLIQAIRHNKAIQSISLVRYRVHELKKLLNNHLSSIILLDCQISDTDIKQLVKIRNLKCLNIGFNRVLLSDISCQSLTQLENLRSLTISRQPISSACLECWVHKFKKLKILFLHECSIQKVSTFSKFFMLSHLTLVGNQLERDAIQHISAMLESLWLIQAGTMFDWKPILLNHNIIECETDQALEWEVLLRIHLRNNRANRILNQHFKWPHEYTNVKFY